jgi:signal transduction histidine kinase
MPASEAAINILLVDDRPENLVSLGAILDSPDYRLIKAESGEEALRAVLDEDFALILMDVQMPRMDGFETATFIKKRPRSKHIPIIFITANSQDEQFVYRGYDAGAVDYILKPIAPDILRSKVAVFADLHRKTRQLIKQGDLQRQNERLERERQIAKLELEATRREHAANQRYRDLVAGLRHAVVWTVDAKTLNATYVSDQIKALLGYDSKAILKDSRILFGAFPEEDHVAMQKALDEIVQNRGTVVLEHRIRNSAGEIRWFQTELRLGESEIRGLSTDVTLIKGAEAMAVEMARTRSEFLSVASHELKTPLTSLKLQVQGLRRFIKRDPASLTERVPPFAERCERQIDRLTRLVDDLLDLSRISNGKLQMVPEDLDLAELVHEVLQRFTFDLAHASCEIRLDAPEPVWGHWDRLRIEQIFTNLLTNSFKYGPGAPIEVRVGREDGMAVLSVRDHGIGISASDQTRIFAQFERVSTTRGPSGLGLGLYIASQIVDAHEGKIEVRSEPGQGSTFTVRLPITQAGLTTSASVPDPQQTPASARKLP